MIAIDVVRGPDPRIHHLAKKDGLRGERAFTPVFDGLCPAMTGAERVGA